MSLASSPEPEKPSPAASGGVGRRRRWLRRLFRVGLAGVLVCGLLVAGSLLWIRREARDHVYSVAGVPAAPVVLVLGAQVYPDGTPSPFLAARLDLAKRLLDLGKARAVLVSGDHGQWRYDEPGAMRRYLVARGVPEKRVVEDHAGFDTYDSCQRALRVFGVRRLIVVTQSFHVDRAVALCRDAGLDAVGVGDESVSRYRFSWLRASVRERFAAVKAAYDVVTGRDPVFLGPRERGVDDALRDG
ncbi:ElyC/SanA/YdcF family protein [Micromonospora sp. NPDC049559]|uniref:SanA/YdcF family protein n=1 Tax=Micromonospora sp. NPDC049559 TaxID=3155923 RepID=UPI0034375C10